MRYKLQIQEKLDAQKFILETVIRRIQNSDISGPETIRNLFEVIKNLDLITERIDLESQE